MIGRRIELFEKFGLGTEVSKYYDKTHRSYLLIARLSKKSREMLDNNYEGIMNSLMGNAVLIGINNTNIDMMSLPWDLFKFSFDITNDSTLDKFLDVVKNVNERIGYCFEDHFMHNKIGIWSLHIESSLFEKIFDNCDCLNQIGAIEDINGDKDLFKGKSTTLLRVISLKDKNDFIVDRKHFVFPEKLTDLCLSKSLSEDLNFLKRIYFLHLSFSSIKESLSILEDVGKLGVQINFLYIRGSNHEEGESLTNPDYYKNGIRLLNYCFKEVHMLTDNFFGNINILKFKFI